MPKIIKFCRFIHYKQKYKVASFDLVQSVHYEPINIHAYFLVLTVKIVTYEQICLEDSYILLLQRTWRYVQYGLVIIFALGLK